MLPSSEVGPGELPASRRPFPAFLATPQTSFLYEEKHPSPTVQGLRQEWGMSCTSGKFFPSAE